MVFATTSTGEELFLADGGVTDWTAHLSGNKKERFFVSGFGTERFCSAFGST